MLAEERAIHISILPKSSSGWWSVSLAAAFILLSILFAALTRSGGEPAPFAVIFVTNITIGISFIAAFITGLIGIIKSKDRAILVFLAVLVGFGALLFFLGELLFSR
jgi:hypothetical protein